MKPVSRRPAWKSGSSRMRRCSGMLVLMPSTTDICRQRRMRAIASGRSRPWVISFRDQAVVVGGHLTAVVGERVHPHAGASRDVEVADGAGRGHEGDGILCVDPALDGVTGRGDVLLREGQGSPAATRICSFTRSRPVTASVTACSTWIRVFISMK